MSATIAYDVAVVGDLNNDVHVFDLSNGNVSTLASLPFGNLIGLSAADANRLIFGTSTLRSFGALHAYSLASSNDLWSPGIQISADFQSAPAIKGNTAYFAGSNGFVYAIDTSSTTPQLPLWSLNALNISANGSIQVGALQFIAVDTLLVFSSLGIVAIHISAADSGTVLWQAVAGSDVSQRPPVINLNWVYTIAAATLYAIDTSATPSDGTLPLTWSWDNPNSNDLLFTFATTLDQIAVLDTQGTLYLIDQADKTAQPGITLSLPSLNELQAAFFKGQLVIADAEGNVSLFTLDLTGASPAVPKTWSMKISNAITQTPLFRTSSDGDNSGVLILLVDNQNSVHALNSVTGSAVWTSTAIADLPASSLQAIGSAQNTLNQGQVKYLMDGEAFFPTLRNLLAALAAGKLDDVSLPSEPKLADMIKTAAHPADGSTNSVFCILWDASNWLRWPVASWQKITGHVIIGLYSNKNTYTTLKDAPNVQAYFQQYNIYNEIDFSSSNHQKIAVFEIAGQRFALVSGINLEANYWDTQAHPACGPEYASLHDSSLLLQGPVVDLIEAEFDRRWGLQGNGAPKPSGSNYAKLAWWAAEEDLGLDNPCTCSQDPDDCTKAPYANPTLTGNTVPIRVVTTDAESPQRVTEIKTAVLDLIATAESYIYFENLAFSDPELTVALANRISTAPSGFQAIVMVPQPSSASDDVFQVKYNIETRIAAIVIYLVEDTWTSLTYSIPNVNPNPPSGPTTGTINRADLVSVKVNVNSSSNGLTSATFIPKSGSSITLLAMFITHIDVSSSRLILCGPARYFTDQGIVNTKHSIDGQITNFRNIYIHSKLALFDDNSAVVGSANWAERSLNEDGELSAIIDETQSVVDIRTELFKHWGMTTVAAWVDDMNTFKTATKEVVGVLPLSVNDMQTSVLGDFFIPTAVNKLAGMVG